MEVRYAIILRAEFVPIGGAPGDLSNPVSDLYVKVLPKGASNVVGLLLGAPTLDAAPYGLGHQRKEQTHYFQALRVHLPRAELGRRATQREEIRAWQDGGSQPGSAEACRLISEPAYLQSASPCAFLDADPFFLDVKDRGYVLRAPVRS